MKKFLFLMLWVLTGTVQAQYIKIDNGVVISSFYNKEDLPLLSEENIVHYSVAIGADYLEKDWFSMSSQVGYMRIGGEETNYFPNEENNHVSEIGDYIHLNSTFQAKIQKFNSRIFAGIGPSVNFLIGNKDFESSLYEEYSFENIHVGGRAELGYTHDLDKFRFGIVGAYLFNISPTAKSEFIEFYNRTFSVMLTAGYRLR